MNNVTLIGRLTADPELKHTQSGLAYTRFSIAVDRAFVKQGEERQADFINIVAWRQTAEFICKYFSKGNRIGITGEIRTGSFTGQDGTKRYTFEVMANNTYFCESKGNSGGNNGGYNNYQNNNYQNNNYQNNNYQQNGYQQGGGYQPQPSRQEPPAPMNNYSNGDAGDYISTPSDEDLPF